MKISVLRFPIQFVLLVMFVMVALYNYSNYLVGLVGYCNNRIHVTNHVKKRQVNDPVLVTTEMSDSFISNFQWMYYRMQ